MRGVNSVLHEHSDRDSVANRSPCNNTVHILRGLACAVFTITQEVASAEAQVCSAECCMYIVDTQLGMRVVQVECWRDVLDGSGCRPKVCAGGSSARHLQPSYAERSFRLHAKRGGVVGAGAATIYGNESKDCRSSS